MIARFLFLTNLTILIFFLCAKCSLAQAPIVLRRADLLRTETSPEGPVRYLDGNVWITQDTLSITCEHAIYEEELGRLFFHDSVHFVEPGRQMWGDRATYYEHDGRATAEGNVRIEEDSLIITCDKVIYQEARKEALFFGDVRIHSLAQNATLTGNHGAYNRPEERGAMSQNPRMVRYFDDSDSVVIVGNVIEYFFADQAALVKDDVYIQRGAFDAWGKILHYKRDGEWARLMGDPIMKSGRDSLRADTVDAYFQNNDIRQVKLSGHAITTSPIDSVAPEPQNRMTGRNMNITFVNGEPDSIYVQGNATSIYYLREKGEDKGANRASGDKIDMKISDGQISWIYVEGGTEGIYFPPQLEAGVEADDEMGPSSVLGR